VNSLISAKLDEEMKDELVEMKIEKETVFQLLAYFM
jgi:hypothetical protein